MLNNNLMYLVAVINIEFRTMNEMMEKVPAKLDTDVQQRSDDLREINVVKYNKMLDNIKTEDVSDITDIGVEYLGQMTYLSNEVGHNNEKVEYMTKFMNYNSPMKKERSDHEDVNTDTGKNNSNCKWLEVGKVEDVKFSISVDVPSIEVGCNSGHREYSASEVIEFRSNIKEEDTYLGDTVISNEKHTDVRSADSEYLKSVGFTCKDVTDGGVRWYQCNFCEYKTTRKDTHRKHFIRKHDENPEWYQCQYCEFRTKIKDSLTRHSTRQHGSHALYQCEFCEFTTKYKLSLKEHFTGRHDTSAEWYQCHLCDFKTKVKPSLSKHFRAKHSSSSECTSDEQNQDCERYKCQHCSFKTKSRESLRNHFKYKHDETAEWYQCHFCDYRTKIRASLKAHFNCKHNQDVEWYHCQKCPFKTENKRYLKKHFTYKHDDAAEWFECKSCEFKTKYDSYLKLHIKTQHEKNKSSKSQC